MTELGSAVVLMACLVGLVAPAAGQVPGGRSDFTDRDPEHEYFVCIDDDRVNDRLVFNQRDADFCTSVIGGEVVLLPAPEAALHMATSKIICYQRNILCLFGHAANSPMSN